MSLRARLLAGMAVVALVLVVAATAITTSTETNLIHQVDQQLDRSALALRARPDPDEDYQQQQPAGPPSSLYAAILDTRTGTLTTVYLPSTTASTPSPPDLTAEEAVARLDTGPFTVGAQDSGLRYRAVVRPDGPGRQPMLFALPLEDVDRAIERLIVIQAIASAAILATLGLVTFWVLRLGVRPLRDMTDTAKRIGDGDLSQRIPDTAPGTEAGELGDALNHMMERIEEAFDERARSEARLRQFVADASHELRTPVTTIRGYAELHRMGGLEDPERRDEAMRRTEQEAARMGQLVADLLDLARLDQGRPLHIVPLDLAALAADAVADARAVEPDRPIDLEAPAPAPLQGDEAHLRQILANLVTNARVHTPAGTPIAVRVRTEGPDVVLEVADQGPGMPTEVAEHVFERFYRADPSRTRSRGGTGLGLSIVASTVAAYGGTVGVETAPGAGTTFRARLPVAGPPPSPGHEVPADQK